MYRKRAMTLVRILRIQFKRWWCVSRALAFELTTRTQMHEGELKSYRRSCTFLAFLSCTFLQTEKIVNGKLHGH